MINPRRARSATGIGAAAAAALGFAAMLAMPTPAAGFVGVSVGVPFGFPFFAPPYPPPPYFPPLPPAPPWAYYPPPPGYPPPAPQLSSGYAPASTAPPQIPSITYTPRRAWTDAAGRQCREYKTTGELNGRRATPVYGSACRDTDGQWRIVN